MKHLVRRAINYGCLMVGILAANLAYAGQYVVTYQGTGSSIQWAGGSNSVSGMNAFCQVLGNITATYTWQQSNDNDSAPASAVLVKQYTAGGGGYGQMAPPTASASDDLGDAQPGSPQGNQLEVMSSGFRYSVQSGAVFTTNCSPSASASVANGSVSVSASYSASAQPVTVSVDGLTSVGPSMWGVLVGQGLAVSLVTPGMSQEMPKYMLANLKQALKYNPDSLDAHFLSGILLDRLGKFKEALAEFQKTAGPAPDDALAEIKAAIRDLGEHEKQAKEIAAWNASHPLSKPAGTTQP